MTRQITTRPHPRGRLDWDNGLQDRLVALAAVPGASWDAISFALGISRNAAIARAAETNVVRTRAPRASPLLRLRGREAYPAGAPETWGLLVAGTCMAGESWPGK